ncbi:hypothetical protein [Portibacter marinus]|uniref:hypothetical protein n=1 Tax=Portibacter marinus TaxID=2898660 RepID=UPI001F471DB5|nr:hypothetical protein [Portibacter marinus]
MDILTKFYKILSIGLLIGMIAPGTANGQITNSDTNSSAIQSDDGHGFDKTAYRSLTIEDYLRKFTEMSDQLEVKNEELASLQYRIEAVKDRSKEVEGQSQKELFRENIRTLGLSENQLTEEIKLLKKGLRLLQENRSSTTSDKLEVLKEIGKIEQEIIAIRTSSEAAKSEIILSKVQIDEREVYLNPPKPTCNIVFNGIDAQTDKPRKETGKEFLFGYTHPKLKNFFKENDFLKCEVKLLELDGKKYLWMYITISSKDAIKNYGYIARNNPMKFELLNGEILYVATAQNAQGRLETITGNTNYEVVLPLDRSMSKQLERGEIDKIGIMWSSGYEQYEIYNVDVVMNQIECLNQL